MHTTSPVTQTFGNLTITTWTDTEGISINIFCGTGRNSTLSATFTHAKREAAIAWYRTIRDAATDGNPVWKIEAMMSALIDAGRAIEGETATLDAYTQPGPRDFTKSRVHRQDPTPAELHAIRHAVDNGDGTFTVRTRPGQTWLVLRGLYRRIGGERTYRKGTKSVIASLTYTAGQLTPYQPIGVAA